MRRIISAMQISVDGFIEDPEVKQDWVDNWEDDYGLTDQVDLCILGSAMYAGYEEYWTAARNPKKKLPFSDRLPTKKEVEYAKWAETTLHILVSRQPQNLKWKNTKVVSDLEAIRKLKNEPGKDIYVIGGAKLVSSMINARLIDEIRLMVHPVLLGGGKALFEGLSERHYLELKSVEKVNPGKLYMIYTLQTKENIS